MPVTVNGPLPMWFSAVFHQLSGSFAAISFLTGKKTQSAAMV